MIWSIGWLVLSLVAAMPVLLLEGPEDAVLYTTVYLIERSLSLDNLFVFLLLFAYFGVPYERRPRLLFWGIVAALAMRGMFILAGSELIEQFHVVIYLLGAALLVLAYRIWRGVWGERRPRQEPDGPPGAPLLSRSRASSTRATGSSSEDGRRYATPLFLCLAAIVFADIAFAIDSIPAAFAITRDPLLIWMGNVFALLGLRALFVLVEGLVARFRYLDETIADRARPGRGEAADRGPGEGRSGGQPGGHRRGVHGRHHRCRSSPTGAIPTPSESASERASQQPRSEPERRRARRRRTAPAGTTSSDARLSRGQQRRRAGSPRDAQGAPGPGALIASARTCASRRPAQADAGAGERASDRAGQARSERPRPARRARRT